MAMTVATTVGSKVGLGACTSMRWVLREEVTKREKSNLPRSVA
jgi:hypothetical protein